MKKFIILILLTGLLHANDVMCRYSFDSMYLSVSSATTFMEIGDKDMAKMYLKRALVHIDNASMYCEKYPEFTSQLVAMRKKTVDVYNSLENQ